MPPNPKGVLFVAHGCNHQAGDFWPASPRCLDCLGLPEEGVVRAAALKRGYAVVAVSSYNRTSKCWHNTEASRSDDLQVGWKPRGLREGAPVACWAARSTPQHAHLTAPCCALPCAPPPPCSGCRLC